MVKLAELTNALVLNSTYLHNIFWWWRYKVVLDDGDRVRDGDAVEEGGDVLQHG